MKPFDYDLPHVGPFDRQVTMRIGTRTVTIKILSRQEENEYFKAADRVMSESSDKSKKLKKADEPPVFDGDIATRLEELLMKRTIKDPEYPNFTEAFGGVLVRELVYWIIPTLHQWPVVRVPLAPLTTKLEKPSDASQK